MQGFLWLGPREDVAGYAKRISTSAKTIKINLAFVKTFQERLAEAISQARKPKSALAQQLGVPQSSVSRWLAGSVPRAETVGAIAKFLNVDVKWLAYGEEPPPGEFTKLEDSDSSVVREEPAPYNAGGGTATRVLETAQAKDATMQIMLRAIAEMQRRIDTLEEIVKQQPPK